MPPTAYKTDMTFKWKENGNDLSGAIHERIKATVRSERRNVFRRIFPLASQRGLSRVLLRHKPQVSEISFLQFIKRNNMKTIMPMKTCPACKSKKIIVKGHEMNCKRCGYRNNPLENKIKTINFK